MSARTFASSSTKPAHPFWPPWAPRSPSHPVTRSPLSTAQCSPTLPHSVSRTLPPPSLFLDLILTLYGVDYSAIECPAPLIRNDNRSIERFTCPGNTCCVSCPYLDNFFPVGYVRMNVSVILAFTAIFFFFSLATFVTYVVIPSKRKYPQNIIAAIGFCLCFTLMSTWVEIFVGYPETLCDNAYDLVSHPILFTLDLFFFSKKFFNLLLGFLNVVNLPIHCEFRLHGLLRFPHFRNVVHDHVVRNHVLQHFSGSNPLFSLSPQPGIKYPTPHTRLFALELIFRRGHNM